MQIRFPRDTIRVWYGFRVGSSAGSGILAMEDRTTYHSRSNATLLPYDAILHHELAHTYMGSETLTQFLELYVYNVLQTGSMNIGEWTHTRNYVPMLESNADIAAVLDVYALLGASAMSDAYRAVYPLRPVSGRPLGAAVISGLCRSGAGGRKVLVAEKLARVSF